MELAACSFSSAESPGNTSNNTSELAIVADMLPKDDGTITILIEAAASNDNSGGYFYFGALKTIYAVELDPVFELTVNNGTGSGEYNEGDNNNWDDT